MSERMTDEQLDPREVLNFLADNIEAVERLQEENEQLKNDKALLLKIDKKYQQARELLKEAAECLDEYKGTWSADMSKKIRALLDGEDDVHTT